MPEPQEVQFYYHHRKDTGRWSLKWVFPWEPRGKFSGTKSFDTKAEARVHAKEIQGQVDSGLLRAPGELLRHETFGSFAEYFLAGRRGAAKNTVVSERYLYDKLIAPHWATLTWSSLVGPECRRQSVAWITGLSPKNAKDPGGVRRRDGRPVSRSTISAAYRLWKKIVFASRAEGYPATIPFEQGELTSLKLIPRERTPAWVRMVLQPHEVTRLADSITLTHPQYRLYIILAAYMGLRIGEAFGLRMKHILDIDGIQPSLLVETGEPDEDELAEEEATSFYESDTKTLAGMRRLDIDALAVKEIKDHVERFVKDPGDPDALLFVNAAGRPVDIDNFRQRVFHPAVKRAGLRAIKPHYLRHTHGSTLAQDGISAQKIADRLGHANASVAQRLYVHRFPQDNPDLVAKVEQRHREGQVTSVPFEPLVPLHLQAPDPEPIPGVKCLECGDPVFRKSRTGQLPKICSKPECRIANKKKHRHAYKQRNK